MPRCASLSYLLLTFLFAACAEPGTDVTAFREAEAVLAQHTASLVAGRDRIRDLAHAYNQTVVPAQRITVHFERCSLMARDREAIARRIESEPDLSCRALLENIIDLDDALLETCDVIDDVTASLPPAVRVSDGDNHYALCRRWLMREHGLARAQADSILSHSSLTSHLVAGNDVWMAWDGTSFATFVAQGVAPHTPAEAARAARLLATQEAVQREADRSRACVSVLDSVKRAGMLVGSVQTAVVP